MSKTIKNETTMAEWKKIVKNHPEANFLQSPAYGRMNAILGDKVIFENFGNKGHALMIVRDAKRGRYLEIPCGPLIEWDDKAVVKKVFTKIRQIAKKERCVFVRIRPQFEDNAKNLALLKELGLRKSPMHLAAEHTVVIDLTQPEDKLLANMRRQTRYEVRKADRYGITVEKSRAEELFREFHEVQTQTAKRQGFIPPDLKTLMAEREAFGKNIDIYVARTAAEPTKEAPSGLPKDSPIAYGMVIKDGKEGDYYEAASTDLNRKLPGAYALLWQAMKDLKKEGYDRFNLWGIAPPGQPNHRYAGVTTFKTGFGGSVTEYVPAHDMVISRLGYLKNLIVETARKKRRHL